MAEEKLSKAVPYSNILILLWLLLLQSQCLVYLNDIGIPLILVKLICKTKLQILLSSFVCLYRQFRFHC